MYLNYAEIQAKNHNTITMKDWVKKLNTFMYHKIEGKCVLVQHNLVNPPRLEIENNVKYIYIDYR